MNAHVHLAIPPNIARRVRAELAAQFPGLTVGAPDLHREMFDFARQCGEAPPPALSVSAYPQLVQNVLRFGASRFATPHAELPPLRPELESLGIQPPSPKLRVIAVVPCVLACNDVKVPILNDWEDLCGSGFRGILGTPPLDTPLPYVLSAFLEARFGERSQAVLSRLDTDSTPLDINKRVAAGDLDAGVLIPSFGRAFRNGGARVVWPKSGAIAVPLVACIGVDAPEVAHEAMACLLSAEMQTYLSLSGGLVPVRAGVSGFHELEEAGWNLAWLGWDALLGVASTMAAILKEEDPMGQKKAIRKFIDRKKNYQEENR